MLIKAIDKMRSVAVIGIDVRLSGRRFEITVPNLRIRGCRRAADPTPEAGATSDILGESRRRGAGIRRGPEVEESCSPEQNATAGMARSEPDD